MSLLVSSGGLTMLTPPYPVSKLTVDGYHRMIQTGILTEDDPVEFLEGWIVPKMPHNPPHDGTVQRANKVLSRRLPPGWEVRIQSAVTTVDREAEPALGAGREAVNHYN